MKIKSINICPNNSNAYRITGMTAMGTKIGYIGRLAVLPASEIKMLVAWFGGAGETEWTFRFRPAAYKFLIEKFESIGVPDLANAIKNAPRYKTGQNMHRRGVLIETEVMK